MDFKPAVIFPAQQGSWRGMWNTNTWGGMSYGEKGKQFISENKAKDKTMSPDTAFILRLYQICAILIF